MPLSRVLPAEREKKRGREEGDAVKLRSGRNVDLSSATMGRQGGG